VIFLYKNDHFFTTKKHFQRKSIFSQRRIFSHNEKAFLTKKSLTIRGNTLKHCGESLLSFFFPYKKKKEKRRRYRGPQEKKMRASAGVCSDHRRVTTRRALYFKSLNGRVIAQPSANDAAVLFFIIIMII